MKFSNPRLFFFKDEIAKMAERFRLNADDLLVESYEPRTTAIVVETVDNHRFRVHINLQENRIIAAKQLDADRVDKAKFEKYLVYMK